MSGDSKNTALWQSADVYIGVAGASGPADLTSVWPVGFSLVGLLDGAEGFTEAREGDSNERYAWGGILYRRTASKHKRTFKFVALEDNAVTFGLVNPGSTRSTTAGVRKAKIKAPLAGVRFSIGFEIHDGVNVKRRVAKFAEVVELGEIKESEEDPTVFEITVVIFPDSDGVLYETIETDPVTGAVTP